MRCIYFAVSGTLDKSAMLCNDELLLGIGPTQVKAQFITVTDIELANTYGMPEVVIPNVKSYLLYDGQDENGNGLMAVFTA